MFSQSCVKLLFLLYCGTSSGLDFGITAYFYRITIPTGLPMNTADCPYIVEPIKYASVSSKLSCSLQCQERGGGCHTYRISGSNCLFYDNHIFSAPNTTDKYLGQSNMYNYYTTRKPEQWPDVARLVPVSGSTMIGHPTPATATAGAACIALDATCWYSGPGTPIILSLGKSYTVRKIIITLGALAAEIDNSFIKVGNLANMLDPTFGSIPMGASGLTPGNRLTFEGSMDGQFVAIGRADITKQLALCLVEVYGHHVP